MGLFDNTVNEAVPGGNFAKPLVIALGALLLKKILTKDEPTAAPAPAPTPIPPQGAGGGLIGGLGDIIGKFQQSGYGPVIQSWIGNGANQPIQPGQLGNALGQKTLSEIAAQSGLNEQQLLEELSKVLPNVIDKLTPNGRIPTHEELGRL